MKAITRWFADRTGWSAPVERCEARRLAGGARWRNAWTATLVFTFTVQVVTGLLMWMYYSPGVQNAWESVYYFQHEVAGGWLVRGVHHFSAQMLVALALIYMVEMVIRGGYRAPREFVFWSVVLVGVFAMAMCLTGDLLAWTQNGFWATRVRVGYLKSLPWVGDDLFRLAAGGPDFGQLTLTRFFALHAGVFAPLLAMLLWLHVRLRRRAEAIEVANAERLGWYWPNQAARNAVACLGVAVVVGLLVTQNAWLHKGDHAGRNPAEYLGTELGAPADPATSYDAARPEWSLLGLYELATMFPSGPFPGTSVSWEVVPIFVIPGLLLLFFLIMPLVARRRRAVVVFAVATAVILVGLISLSMVVVVQDRGNEAFQAALTAGRHEAERAVALAQSPIGIPAGGVLTLVRDDPKTQGPRLFASHCASCHNHVGSSTAVDVKAEVSSAPNLAEFASHEWIKGFLDPKKIDGPEYYGDTALKDGAMVDFVKGNLRELVDDMGEAELDKLIAVLAEGRTRDMARPAEEISEETKFLFEDFTCTDCHKFYDLGIAGGAPDLTGYGTREWIIGAISDPTLPRFYGIRNDRMPAFAQDPHDPASNLLTPRQVEMLTDWLRGEWYEPGE